MAWPLHWYHVVTMKKANVDQTTYPTVAQSVGSLSCDCRVGALSFRVALRDRLQRILASAAACNQSAPAECPDDFLEAIQDTIFAAEVSQRGAMSYLSHREYEVLEKYTGFVISYSQIVPVNIQCTHRQAASSSPVQHPSYLRLIFPSASQCSVPPFPFCCRFRVPRLLCRPGHGYEPP